MAELTIDYTLSYKVSIDVDKMWAEYPDIIEEYEADEYALEEWVRDFVMMSLEGWEDDKLHDRPLPHYVTHFSVNERVG